MTRSSIISLATIKVTFIIVIILAYTMVRAEEGNTMHYGENELQQDTYVYLPQLYSPCGPGMLIFSDDFSDPNSGWMTWDNDQSQVAYVDGELRLLAKVLNSHTGLADGHTSASDYIQVVDVRNVSGIPGRFGLLFGFRGGLDYSFYSFMITSAGDYYLALHEQDYPDPMVTTILHSGWSEHIYTGVQSNKIAVIHRPTSMHLLANDQLLGIVYLDTQYAEQMGLLIESTTEPYLDIRYDNYSVYEYACHDQAIDILNYPPTENGSGTGHAVWLSELVDYSNLLSYTPK